MVSRRAVLPNAQPTEVVQPRQSSLHVPAIFSQAAAIGRTTTCDVWPDTATSQLLAMRVGVITPISIEAVRTPPRSAPLAAHRRDRVDQQDHRIDVGNVGGGRLRHQWHAPRIGDQLVLAPLLTAVYGAGAGLPTA